MNDTSAYDQVVNAMIGIVSGEPKGIRSKELAKRIRKQFQGTAVAKSIGPPKLGQIFKRYTEQPDAEIYKPARGVYSHTTFQGASPDDPQALSESPAEQMHENAFYRPFADWLVEDVEECTKAIPTCGPIFRDKWGTPDVIGVYKPFPGDMIPFPIEVVSAEIKVATQNLITAFGQACSYKLFSHKSYIAIPETASDEDKDRLEALCLIFGIGLVLFDPTSPQNPGFTIRTRASKHEPDSFYVNEKMKLIARELLG